MLKSYIYNLITAQILTTCLGMFPGYNNKDIRTLNNDLKIKIDVVCFESLDSIKTKIPQIARIYMTEKSFYEFSLIGKENLGEKCIQHISSARLKVKLLKKTDEDIVARYQFDEMMRIYKKTRKIPFDMIKKISVTTKDSCIYNIFFNEDSTYSLYSDTGILISTRKMRWK